MFNQKWKPTLANLQASLPRSTIVYSNRYDVAVQTLQNPTDYGKVCRQIMVKYADLNDLIRKYTDLKSCRNPHFAGVWILFLLP